MAESKTEGRRPGAANAGKGAAKEEKEAAKPAKRAAKAAKVSAGTAKAPAGSAKAPAKTAKAGAKTAKAPAKTAKAPAKGAKSSARTGKSGPKSRKATAKTVSDSAKAVAAPASAAPAATASPAPKPAAARAPAKRKVVQDAARSYFDAVAARDAATMAAHWHREGVHDSVPLGVFRGPEAVRRLYQETFTAMPDIQITVERITADDRVAAVQWRARGTFSGGPFQGFEPTGRRVELRGIDCLEVEEGKILRNTSVYDGAAVARGMGLLPAEDSGADRAMRAGLNTVTKLRRVVAGRIGGSQ
ncbi:MAG: ester cyclase [Actinomycetota bacterium]|nr:ester cyclase [Actinomycetota bacterium]